MITEIFFSYVIIKDRLINEIDNNSQKVVERLSNNLVVPMWNFSNMEIDRIIMQEMGNKDILLIAVYNRIGEKSLLLSGKIRVDDILNDYNNSVDEAYIETNTLKRYSNDILYDGQIIGSIVLISSNKTLISSISSMLWQNVLQFLSVIIILVVMIFFILKILVLDPVIVLRDNVFAFSNQDFHSRVPIKSNDEIGELSRAFNNMAEKIQVHNTELLGKVFFDNLTNLANRQKLLKDLEKPRESLLLLINIDGFQEINDFYGDSIGDSILIEMSRRLQECNFGYLSRIYKLQADEFGVLMRGSFVKEGLDEHIKNIIASTIFQKINDEVFIIEENEISIRATVGVAHLDDTYLNYPIKVLYHADMALKKAKKLQKHYILYNEQLEISKEYESNLKWTIILKNAIADDKILPYFQPIVNNQTGKVEKFECLCRLQNSTGDIITPFFFLDIAKKTRLYPTITKIMLEKSFKSFQNNNYEFSINLSLVDIINEDTRQFIRNLIKENPDVSKRVVFEILESEGLRNYVEMKNFIDEVKKYGCKIAIDDFGSGYSNFEHIIQLKVDYLKIDASMIKNIHIEKESEIITRTIVNFSQELGIQTVSEFVHSEDVYNKVRLLGVDFSQGYYFGQPKDHVYTPLKV